MTGTEIYQLDNETLNTLSLKIPALLGHLRKFYSSILVDAGQHIRNPILSTILSQCDDIAITRNANSNGNDPQQVREWRKTIAYATDCKKDFFKHVTIISDDCSARGESAPKPINTYSALYKSHFNLRTNTMTPPTENREKEFLKCIYRIARKLNRTSRGLVLSGGGMRSCCHIGAIDVLEEEGIYFDGVAGTSMGSIIAALYAMGENIEETMRQLIKNDMPNSKTLLEKTFPFVSFFSDRKFNAFINKMFGKIRFEDLDIPFYCNSSDLLSCQMVVFERGYIGTSIRASGGIPAFFHQ